MFKRVLAEHLQPGESYAEGARRGLQEELGVVAPASSASDSAASLSVGVPVALASLACFSGPLAPSHARCVDLPQLGVRDYEFVESYKLVGYEGAVSVNVNEVRVPASVCMRMYCNAA